MPRSPGWHGRWAALLLALMAAVAVGPVGAAELPRAVQQFLAQREACDHWRGEEGYDPARQAEIAWSLCQYCTGTDAQLARLKQRYRGHQRVLTLLAEFDPAIEAPDQAAARRLCRRTPRPQ